MKIPVVNRDDYIIYLERVGNLTFVHCDVFKWSRHSKDSLIEDWETLCKLHKYPIYAYHYIGDRKHEKFLKMTGFKYLKSGVSTDLRQIEIHVKEVSHGT